MKLDRERYASLTTASLSDAMDRLGIAGQALGIAPLDPGFRLLGRAFTVRYAPCGLVKGTVGDYIDDVEADQVMVLDNQGRLDCTVWGDILTGLAHRRGLPGTVINGVCRDVSLSLDLGYPIFSRGRYMRTGKDRVQADEVNTPVSLGSVRVEPGDVLFGDADGIVVLPTSAEEQILALAQEIEAAERQIREAVEGGASLRDARAQFRYHNLQTREEGP